MGEQTTKTEAKKETPDIPEPEGLKQLRESFAKIYDGPDSLQHAYGIVEEAKRLNIPLDIYRYLYEHKSDVPLPAYPKCQKWQSIPPEWSRWFVSLPPQKRFSFIRNLGTKAFQGIAIGGILFSVFQFIIEIPARKRQEHNQAWQTIDMAQGKHGAGGRIEAIQNLNNDRISLEGIPLENSFLKGIKLKNADLAYSNFGSTDLESADLQDANFKKAIFSGGASLLGAKLQGANCSNADFTDANLQNADLQDANLQKTNLIRADFSHANLNGANLSGSVYSRETRFPENFVAANQHIYLIGSNAKLSNADLREIDLFETSLTNAKLQGADLRGAKLQGADLRGADLRGADLKGALLQNADVQGADLRGTFNIPFSIHYARNWQWAHYNPEFRKELGLLPEK